jgi:thiol-disulfide isomerase/thioredoxin
MLLVLAGACKQPAERGATGPVGVDAADFTLPDLDGKPVTLSSFKGNKPVMIDFWASWCAPCQRTLPHVDAINSKYGTQVEVLAVSLDNKKEDAQIFIRDKGYKMRVLWLDGTDPTTQKIVEAYNVGPIPNLIFIDKQGKIQSNVTGAHDEAQIMDELKKIGVGS